VCRVTGDHCNSDEERLLIKFGRRDGVHPQMSEFTSANASGSRPQMDVDVLDSSNGRNPEIPVAAAPHSAEADIALAPIRDAVMISEGIEASGVSKAESIDVAQLRGLPPDRIAALLPDVLFPPSSIPAEDEEDVDAMVQMPGDGSSDSDSDDAPAAAPVPISTLAARETNAALQNDVNATAAMDHIKAPGFAPSAPVQTSLTSAADSKMVTRVNKPMVSKAFEVDHDDEDDEDDDDDDDGDLLQLTGDIDKDRALLQALARGLLSGAGKGNSGLGSGGGAGGDEDLDDVDDDDDAGASNGPLRTANEVPPEAVPVEPVTGIVISDSSSLYRAGSIMSRMADMVVIQGSRNSKVLDSGSVVCLDDRTALGRVDDVFGPVTEPFYTVRFAKESDIPAGAVTGATVFYPGDASSFVMPDAIKNQGSDASNRNDEEPAPKELDYSDDEEEAMAKAQLRSTRKQQRGAAAGDETTVMDTEQAGSAPTGASRGRGRGGRGSNRGGAARPARGAHAGAVAGPNSGARPQTVISPSGAGGQARGTDGGAVGYETVV